MRGWLVEVCSQWHYDDRSEDTTIFAEKEKAQASIDSLLTEENCVYVSLTQQLLGDDGIFRHELETQFFDGPAR